MTFDPLTNRVPTHLLTAEEKQALIDWPHGLLFHSDLSGRWEDRQNPLSPIADKNIYRGKPAPVVTRLWANVYPNRLGWSNTSRATCDREGIGRIGVARVEICAGKVTAYSEDI